MPKPPAGLRILWVKEESLAWAQTGGTVLLRDYPVLKRDYVNGQRHFIENTARRREVSS